MGCDIHLFVEKRDGDRWVCVDKLKREEPEGPGDKGYLTYAEYDDLFYTGRNYNLFAILADVRNGRGFAGVKTGEGFVPIAEPRGLPADASAELREMSDVYGADGHSHSYHTLRQLLDYDWTQTTTLQGWVDFKTWAKWAGYGRKHGFGPEGYCGGVSGGGVQHITADAMDALVKRMNIECAVPGDWAASRAKREAFEQEHCQHYAVATWQPPYHREADSFLSETVPRLLKLAGGTAGLDDVRAVFWFDN